jgi:hypothetical protein
MLVICFFTWCGEYTEGPFWEGEKGIAVLPFASKWIIGPKHSENPLDFNLNPEIIHTISS